MLRVIVLISLIAGVAVADTPKAKTADAKGPDELVGSIVPSIHVPPVRLNAPAKTKPIVRPQQYDPQTARRKQGLPYRIESLRLAIEDLKGTFGTDYPRGREFLNRLRQLEQQTQRLPANSRRLENEFRQLRDEATLANPLMDFASLLVLKRKKGQLGLPTNHQCNTTLQQTGYDNELAVLSPPRPDGRLTTLLRPPNGYYIGETELHFDADRLLLTMPNGRTWQIHEVNIDGTGLRQVSKEIADVDNFDGCYLPDDRIVFSSTASYTAVPCWHGQERACCLYRMDSDGENVRQLCFDQDLDLHPSVLADGQILFSRWDYTGPAHAYVRPLMVMNPDGTNQRAVYGSNSYYPNCLFFPRGVPGKPEKIAAVLTGYHGSNRSGELAVLDISNGWYGDHGIVSRITHRDEPIVPVAMDQLTQKAMPQFLHPYPLSDKYIVTAMKPAKNAAWGIYLVDVFDNVTPVLTDPKHDLFEPQPIVARKRPPVLADRTDESQDSAVVMVHDIYQGPGLRGVPRGTIKRIRVAAYNFGFPGMAGPDKVGRAGPWEAIRILGTVPVHEDGSARFEVPASTPITLQPLDAEGKAVQLMRSWYTAMPGETTSCVGCHETPHETPGSFGNLAADLPVSEITPWYGPSRGFDFAREVQPVLDRHCVGCHDGQEGQDAGVPLDLRREELVSDYKGLPLTRLGASRIDPSIPQNAPQRFLSSPGMPEPYGNLRTHYTPAYEALVPYIRRVNIEDGVGLLLPGEYHADTSELIRILQQGHHGVSLDQEAWDRLVTWIDLNGPCHGTWGDVAEIPGRVDLLRFKLGQAFGGPAIDAELASLDGGNHDGQSPRNFDSVMPVGKRLSSQQKQSIARQLRSQLSTPTAGRRPHSDDSSISLKLGDGVVMHLERIDAGTFVMGDSAGVGSDDEWPPDVVAIERPYWIGRTEVINQQLRAVIDSHSSGVFTKRQIDRNGPGIQMDFPHQPAVRVSWTEAMEFCRRLSERSDYQVTLPTEAQWENAARAGSSSPLAYGNVNDDFSQWANMADRSLACLYEGTAGVALMQPIPSLLHIDDEAIATADVASYRPNQWGLFDMHGNAAEWTRSVYRPYQDNQLDNQTDHIGSDESARRVVRGGSFYDRPQWCRSSSRRSYPQWQAVHDVGFRVVIEP
ncbi:MAG: formylglycine-generating enzyme family protein [Fuerstiella sp.]|nr:formylglycine-generating enzyme family protein [Fuerstiella sp.]